MIELAQHMRPVAATLLGEPNRHLSNGKELRYGSHGSLSVDLEAGTWFDHERKVGGGVLDLVGRQLRSDRPGALAWLREQGIVDDTPAEDRPRKRPGASSPATSTRTRRAGRATAPCAGSPRASARSGTRTAAGSAARAR